MQGARGDVDVGDLLRSGLERGEWPAELLPRRNVLRGQRQRAGDRAVGQAARSGARELVEVGHHAACGARAEHVADRRRVQPQRVLGLAGRAVCAPPGQPARRPRDDHDRGAGAARDDSGRHQDPVGGRAAGHADLYAGDRAGPVGQAGRRGRDHGHHPRWLAHRGGEQGVTGRHAVQHRLLQVAVTPTDDGQHAEGQRGQGGHRSGPPADLGQRRGHGHHAELVPAEKGRQRERQQPRPAEFLPQRGVIGPRLSGRLGMVEHLGGGAGDRLLGLTEGEVHPDRHRSS